MPGIVGVVDTFNTPNYVGELFQISTTDTPFLSAIGGLTGGDSRNAVYFGWQQTDLRDADTTRQRLEGQDAPDPEARTRTTAYNVVEIHQESVEITYTRLAASGQMTANIPRSAGRDQYELGTNPVNSELQFQVNAALRQIARDIEKTFITGTFANPEDNTTPRRTRGLLQAITTNVVTNGSPTALTERMVLDTMQLAWENGGLAEGETATLITNATQKRNLTKIFLRDNGFSESDRNIAGVHVTTIETDFGVLNIMLDRYMPNDTLVFASLEECAPVFLEVPNKGFLFLEPLAKTGARDAYQIYGEVGLRYGNERKHAKITGLSTTVQ